MPERIEMIVPPQPPDGSVILDHDGFAWQRFGEVWYRCGPPLSAIRNGGT